MQVAKVSDFIDHAPETINPGDKVIICCRVSDDTQNKNGNLDDQERNDREEINKLGAEIIGVFKHEGSGLYPYWLAPAAKQAKKDGAILVAESPNRFIRHAGFHHRDWPNLQARKIDLEYLRLWTEGVPLATLLHPDASLSEEKGFQISRGQKAKQRPGGRPKKKEPRGKKRREFYLPQAIMLRKAGMSFRQIADKINEMMDDRFGAPCHGTIRNWLDSVETDDSSSV